MSAPNGAQYAVQIAVQTLRDRCKNLQQRVLILEEENINLRIQCSRNEDKDSSLSEIDRLRRQITELTEQKEQAHNKLKMVTSENQELWSKLGKLTRVNKSLGNQLTQINNTLSQHLPSETKTVSPSNLIRSKTFTRDEMQTKILHKNLDENDKISLELEDISLKLTDSFSKQKKELDLLCSEIAEIQFSDGICENYGFAFDEELEDDFIEEFKQFFDEIKTIKHEVLQQRDVLTKSIKNVENLKEKYKSALNKTKNKELTHQSTCTSDLIKNHTVDRGTTPIENIGALERSPTNNVQPPSPKVPDKICPICTKLFKKDVDFTIFQQHVEDHFTPDVESYEIL